MKFVCIVFELGDKMLTLPSMENLKRQLRFIVQAFHVAVFKRVSSPTTKE